MLQLRLPRWSSPRGCGLRPQSAHFARRPAAGPLGRGACAVGQGTEASANISPNDDERRYKKIKLVFPSGDPSKPFTTRRYSSLSRRDLVAGSRGMGDTLVPMQQLAGRAELPEEWELTPLSEVHLEDGGEYLVVTASDPLSGQLKELQGWQRNTVRGHEDEDAERAVQWLRGKGQPDARRVCTKRLEMGDTAVELDGLVVSSEYVVIVESKDMINLSHTIELMDKLDRFMTILAMDGFAHKYPELAGLAEKCPLLVLSGRSVVQDPARQRSIRQACVCGKIEVWLPQSTGGLGPHSSCFESAYLHFPGMD